MGKKFTAAASSLLVLFLSGSGFGNTSSSAARNNNNNNNIILAAAFQLPPSTTTATSRRRTSTSLLNAGLRDLTDPYFDDRPPSGRGGPAIGGGGDYYPDYGVIDVPLSNNNNQNNNNNNNIGRGVNRLFDGIRNDIDGVNRLIGNNYDEQQRRGGSIPLRGGGGRNSVVGPLSQTRGGRGGDDELLFDRLLPPLVGPPPPPPIGRGGGPLLVRRDELDNLSIVERYFEAWNRRNIALALSCFSNNIYYDDTQFSAPFEGKDKLAEHLIYVADCVPDSFFYVVDELSVGQVQRRYSSRRGGGGGGRLRNNNGRGKRGGGDQRSFRRGRGESVRFDDDDDDGRPTVSVSALWHVENEFGPLPYARGCSFFKIDPNTNLIVEGYEFPEPAVIKPGSTGLRTLSLASKLIEEPKRLLPFTAFVAYIYVVYFSTGILPGKDFFHSDPKTWIEVQNLSFNFMFIAPSLKLPVAAKLHPMLEGVFNGLLAWAAMFWGFLSDDRTGFGTGYDRDLNMNGRSARYYERLMQNQEQEFDNGIVVIPPVSITKRNLIPLLPTVIGMQFITSAAFLPYLFARTSERRYQPESDYDRFDGRGPGPLRVRPLYREELDKTQVLGEWKGLGILLGSIGLYALWWGAGGRSSPEDVKLFGPPIWESGKRTTEFMKILANDRIAATIILDFWVFGFFQGWLVDDDWKRRGRSLEEESFLRNVAKFIPFFGLAAYLTFRPSYPSIKDGFDEEMYDERTGLLRRRGSRGGNFSRGRGGPPRF